MKSTILAAVLVATLAGCATRGANYVPLVDMKGHEQAQFDRDTTECQQYAKQRMDAASGAVAGAVIGGLLAAALMPRGYRNYGAGQGALVGGVSGGVAANQNQEMITKRCLAGRGYNILN